MIKTALPPASSSTHPPLPEGPKPNPISKGDGTEALLPRKEEQKTDPRQSLSSSGQNQPSGGGATPTITTTATTTAAIATITGSGGGGGGADGVEPWVASQVDPFMSALRLALLRDRPKDVPAYASMFSANWKGTRGNMTIDT